MDQSRQLAHKDIFFPLFFWKGNASAVSPVPYLVMKKVETQGPRLEHYSIFHPKMITSIKDGAYSPLIQLPNIYLCISHIFQLAVISVTCL